MEFNETLNELLTEGTKRYEKDSSRNKMTQKAKFGDHKENEHNLLIFFVMVVFNIFCCWFC